MIISISQLLLQAFQKLPIPKSLFGTCRCSCASLEVIQKRFLSSEALYQQSFTQTEKYNGEKLASSNLPSVTRILSRTKSVENELILLAWKKKMIEKLGEEGFNKMQEATLRAGSQCHKAIENFCKGVPLHEIDVDDSWSNLWRSVQSILADISDIASVEGKVIHPHLKYYGYADCVAKYKGEYCLIDWKTSQKRRYTLQDCYDDPTQVVAYTGAVNCALEPNNQITSGMVVKIYHDGQPATPFLMNKLTMEYYWRQWLQRLAAYNDLQYLEKPKSQKTERS